MYDDAVLDRVGLFCCWFGERISAAAAVEEEEEKVAQQRSSVCVECWSHSSKDASERS